jgi:hypothetical protein
MGLDIRLPIGLMFSIIGALLTVYGAVAGDRSLRLGINVNLVWGACILVFGLIMLASWKFIRRTPHAPHAVEPPPGDRPRGGH